MCESGYHVATITSYLTGSPLQYMWSKSAGSTSRTGRSRRGRRRDWSEGSTGWGMSEMVEWAKQCAEHVKHLPSAALAASYASYAASAASSPPTPPPHASTPPPPPTPPPTPPSPPPTPPTPPPPPPTPTPPSAPGRCPFSKQCWESDMTDETELAVIITVPDGAKQVLVRIPTCAKSTMSPSTSGINDETVQHRLHGRDRRRTDPLQVCRLPHVRHFRPRQRAVQKPPGHRHSGYTAEKAMRRVQCSGHTADEVMHLAAAPAVLFESAWGRRRSAKPTTIIYDKMIMRDQITERCPTTADVSPASANACTAKAIGVADGRPSSPGGVIIACPAGTAYRPTTTMCSMNKQQERDSQCPISLSTFSTAPTPA